MTRLLPSVLYDSDLPLPELCAARLDGEVYAIDECFAPIDEVDGTAARAEALHRLVGDHAIAERQSALWIYGIRSEPPRRHTLCVPRTNRATVQRTRRTIVRETRMLPGDTQPIGRMNVTSPLRTAFDLLRSSRFTQEDRDALTILVDRFGADADACRARIGTIAHLPGRRAALKRIDALK